MVKKARRSLFLEVMLEGIRERTCWKVIVEGNWIGKKVIVGARYAFTVFVRLMHLQWRFETNI